jgi:hypothetical protein
MFAQLDFSQNLGGKVDVAGAGNDGAMAEIGT